MCGWRNATDRTIRMEGFPVTLSIRNVPEDVLLRLRRRAKENHRSLQGELLAIMEEGVEHRRLSIEEAARQIEELGVRTGDESAKMIREVRDAR